MKKAWWECERSQLEPYIPGVVWGQASQHGSQGPERHPVAHWQWGWGTPVLTSYVCVRLSVMSSSL